MLFSLFVTFVIEIVFFYLEVIYLDAFDIDNPLLLLVIDK